MERKARSRIMKTRSDACHLWYVGHVSKSWTQWNKCQVLAYFRHFRCDPLMRFLCLHRTVPTCTMEPLQVLASKHASCRWREIMTFTHALLSTLAVFHSRRNYWVFCVTIQEGKVRVLFRTFVTMFGESQCPINQSGVSWQDRFTLRCALVLVLQRNRTNRGVCGEREIDWDRLIIGIGSHS